MTEIEPMTKYGYEKVSSELNQLKNVEIAKIAKEVETAADLGDLKENAEYHAAKEKQNLAATRIAELSELIGKAQIVEPETLEHVRISFGSTVVLNDLDTEQELTYTIVGGCESNPDTGLISFHSPLAKQLLGKEEGDEIKARLPMGVKEFEVLDVSYKEIVFDCK